MSSAYSNPFEPICLKCNLPAENFGAIQENLLHCTICNADTDFIYSHRLKCNIVNSEGVKVPCVLKSDLLNTVLPALIAVSYHDYLKDKSVMIYFMRSFCFEGLFTVDQHGIIVHLEKQSMQLDVVDISMQTKI